MTKKKLLKNITRRQAIFQFGLTPIEISKLIHDKRIDFIKCGVRNANNVPTEVSKKVDFLAHNASNEQALYEVLDWVATNIESSAAYELKEIFQLLGDIGGHLDHTEEVKPYWRELLYRWSQQPDNVQISSFVFSRLKDATKVVASTKSLREDIATGTEIYDGTLEDIADDDAFGHFISALESLYRGRLLHAEENLDHLRSVSTASSSMMADLVEKILDDKSRSLSLGIQQTVPSKTFLGLSGIDVESFFVIGRMSTQRDEGHQFFRITGLLIGTSLYSLSVDEAKRLFPLSGSAILFASKVPSSYSFPQSSDWLLTIRPIEIDSSSQNTRYEVIEVTRRIYEVVSVPFSSEEAELAREYILNNQYKPEGGLPFFQLKGGALVKFKSDRPKLDEPLQQYSVNLAYEFDNRLIIIDEPKKLSAFIDCSPIELQIKKLLNFLKASDSLPSFSNAEIARFADLAQQDSSTGNPSSYIERVLASIQNLSANRELARQVVDEIMTLPTLVEELEERKAKILEKYKSDIRSEKNELSILRNERRLLEESLADQRSQNEKLISKLNERLVAAYNSASNNGLDILTQAAILKPFLQASSTPTPPGSKMATVTEVDLSVYRNTQTIDDLDLLQFQIATLSRRSSLNFNTLGSSVLLMLRYGLIGTSWDLCTTYADCLSAVLTAGLSCSISLSTDVFSWEDILNLPVSDAPFDCPLCFGSLIERAQTENLPILVKVIGVNRAPVEAFIVELLSYSGIAGLGRSISWRKQGGIYQSIRISTPIYILTSFVSGPSAFKASNIYKDVIPVLPPIDIWTSGREPMEVNFAKSRFLLKNSDVHKLRKTYSNLGRAYLDLHSPDFRSFDCFERTIFSLSNLDAEEIADILNGYPDENVKNKILDYVRSTSFSGFKAIFAQG